MYLDTLEKVKQRLKELQELQEIRENKKTYILDKLTDFACKLENLERDNLTDLHFDINALRYDIEAVKYVISIYQEHYEWLREEDLKRVNLLYKQYKKYIKDYEQTI